MIINLNDLENLKHGKKYKIIEFRLQTGGSILDSDLYSWIKSKVNWAINNILL